MKDSHVSLCQSLFYARRCCVRSMPWIMQSNTAQGHLGLDLSATTLIDLNAIRVILTNVISLRHAQATCRGLRLTQAAHKHVLPPDGSIPRV